MTTGQALTQDVVTQRLEPCRMHLAITTPVARSRVTAFMAAGSGVHIDVSGVNSDMCAQQQRQWFQRRT